MIRMIERLFCWSLLALLGLLVTGNARADEVEPVSIRVQDETVWVGQRATFFVELRAPGSFVGAASFSLPAISQTVIVKTGNPVVSSKQIAGETYFVQTHRFALFTQASGTLEIPSFAVRFRHRNGFTGPAYDRQVSVPSAVVEVQRPPQSDQLGFLIATSRFEVDQSWKPEPGVADQGAIFKRVISQQAEEMTGMALFPPPIKAREGVRIYAGRPEVADNTERGNLNGRRSDTLTYVFERPGTVTIPAIEYVWWDPQQSQFFSRTLPATTFDIVPLQSSDQAESATDFLGIRFTGDRVGAIVFSAIVFGGIVWRRKRLMAWCVRRWSAWFPADARAANQLIRACRRNDAGAAERAWNVWLSNQPHEVRLLQQLQEAIGELHRLTYGKEASGRWEGESLERAFRQQLAHRTEAGGVLRQRSLPRLNPVAGE